MIMATGFGSAAAAIHFGTGIETETETAGSYFNPHRLSFVKMPTRTTLTKSNHLSSNRKFTVQAHLSDSDRSGGGGDFVAGFLLGGAVCGTLAYFFAPQIRRSLLNEDEYGFRKARRPIYYDDEGLEKTRQTLNAKLSQLNAAIDNVSSRLRGVNNMPSVPVASDPEVEATM